MYNEKVWSNNEDKQVKDHKPPQATGQVLTMAGREVSLPSNLWH